MAGIYPAIIISHFQPLELFKPATSKSNHKYLRKTLVMSQFVTAFILIIATLFLFDQLKFLHSQDLGFAKDEILNIRFDGNKYVQKQFESIKLELAEVEGVSSVSSSNAIPGESTTNLYTEIETEPAKMSYININTNFVDHEFLDAYRIPVIAGRNFSREFPSDQWTAFIVNESALAALKLSADEAVGRKINQQEKKGTIIGVMKDFHYRSLHHKVEPLLYTINPYVYTTFSLRINLSDIPTILKKVENKWRIVSNNLPFQYSFLNEDLEKYYKSDIQLANISALFTGLAIIVASLGLIGLSSFSVEDKLKEISIRKILGASEVSIALIVSKDFLMILFTSFVISIPIGIYLVKDWLENFAIRIAITPSNFLIAGVGIFLTAALTLGFFTFRAMSVDPTRNLKNL